MPRRRPARAPRTRPVAPRAAVTVDALVTAAEIVLDRHGPDGLTTNRVAEVAGVSVGSLYQYFPNKEALVAAVAERYLDRTLVMVRAALAASTAVPIDDGVTRLAAGLTAARISMRPIHRWLIELRTAAAFQERLRRQLDDITALVAAFLAARPDLRLADAGATAFVLVHAVQGVIDATTARGATVDIDAITMETARLVRAHLGAAAAPPAAPPATGAA